MTSKTIALRFIGHSLKIPSEFHSYLDAITKLCSGNGELSGGMSLGDVYVQYQYNSDATKKAKKFSNDVNLQHLTDGKSAEFKAVILGLTFEDNEIIPTLFEAVSGVIANERIPSARFEIDENNTIGLKKTPFAQEAISATEQASGAAAAPASESKGKTAGKGGNASGPTNAGYDAGGDNPQHVHDPHEAVQ